MADYRSAGAVLSECGTYRYRLTREWSDEPHATFVMLNPSTADASQDDPTIRRCVGFAKALGCGGLTVANLYAYRATKPADLWRAFDPIGPDNDDHLRDLGDSAGPVIAAWGAHGKPDRVARVRGLLGADLMALGFTKDGAPRHPLYMPSAARPVRWEVDRGE